MHITASLKKAFQDLWVNRPRAFLVWLALVVGIVGAGSVAVTYSILIREMDVNYLKTIPASATLQIEPVTDDMARSVSVLPFIANAEGRSFITGRFKMAPGEWKELWLYVIPDFNNIRLDKFTPEQGKWPPANGEILLERTAVRVAKATLGDMVTIKLPGGTEHELRFSGTVHTPGLPPAWVEGRVYGYITTETMNLLGGGTSLNQLKILVAKDEFNKSAVIQQTNELRDWLTTKGITVTGIEIPEPGKHIHADLMAAFITMLGAMGVLSFIMSSILVTNIINTLLSQQIRQIGVMKAIGADAWDITKIYLSMVMVLGLLALAAGLPLSLFLGSRLSAYEAEQMLNFQVFDYRVDLWVYLMISGLSIQLPVLATLYPVIRTSRIPVLAALNEIGTGRSGYGSDWFERRISSFQGFARPILLSLRNVFRRRTRLILTLLTLSVAGANFITAMNVGASIDRSIEEKFKATPYDLQISFSKPYPQEDLIKTIRNVAGVKSVEVWGAAISTVILDNGQPGKNLNLIAAPEQSELSPKPRVIAGRWLKAGDRSKIVMSDSMLELLNQKPVIGLPISLETNGRLSRWELVGITREFLANGAFVSPGESFSAGTDKTVLNSSLVVKLDSPLITKEVTKDLEIRLAQNGFDVLSLWKLSDTRKVMEDHMMLIIGILLTMAGLFVVIGALGMGSTMSMNVLERTRELGIIRAIGATTSDVLLVIFQEGAFTGMISWLLALIVSIPYSLLMGQVFGLLLKNPINLTTSFIGWFEWLIAAVVISGAASFIPAWFAVSRPVNSSLIYE